MTTYTMNGHRHSTRELQPKILLGIVENRIAKFARARWQMRVPPEKFHCLESAEPEEQIQAALQQIETLLYKNAQLLETVLLLSQALTDSHSSADRGTSIAWSERCKLRLSHNAQDHTEQLRGGVQTHVPLRNGGSADRRRN